MDNTRMRLYFSRLVMAVVISVFAGNMSALAQNVRLLVLRVEFPRENPDESSTTGDGTFDLRTVNAALTQDRDDLMNPFPYYRYPFDPPPHDMTYLNSHLTALSTYISTASQDQMVLSAHVFPVDGQTTYTVPKSLIYYGSGLTSLNRLDRWSELARDAILLAQSDIPDFSNYDSFLIFHASIASGGLISNDIPPLVLSPDELMQSGVTSIPQVVMDTGVWMMPQALANIGGVIGLNGAFAKTFLASRGLPVLSNTTKGTPSVGGWAIMDTGSDNFVVVDRPSGSSTRRDTVFGFVPSLPMAWEQIKLGWIDPVTINKDTLIQLAALGSNLPGVAKAIILPITEDEYFLLENRQGSYQNSSIPVGVTFDRDDTSGVWLTPDGGDYDAFIPGSGILIWHVDERRIRDGLADNTVNAFENSPGIWLVEADGYRDVGISIGLGHPRADQGIGSDDDPFHSGRTLFATDPVSGGRSPVSLSNDTEETGIRISVADANAELMSVNINFKNLLWLVERPGGAVGSPQMGQVKDDGTYGVVWAAEDGRIWAVDLSGNPIGPDSGLVGTTTLPLDLVAPVIVDRPGVIVVGSANGGRLFRYISGIWSDGGDTTFPTARHFKIAAHLGDQTESDTPDTVDILGNTGVRIRFIDGGTTEITFPAPAMASPIVARRKIFAVIGNAVWAWEKNGIVARGFPKAVYSDDPDDKISSQPLVFNLPTDGNGMPSIGILVTTRSGRIHIIPMGDNGAVRRIFYPGGEISGAAMIDSRELASSLQNGKFYALLRNGMLVAHELGLGVVEGIWKQQYSSGDHRQLSAFSPVLDFAQSQTLRSSEKVYALPNPVGQAKGFIRFFLSEPAEVTISIFTTSGELVYESSLTGVGGLDNQIEWPGGTRFASGLYLCRLRTVSADGTVSETLIKLAIAK